MATTGAVIARIISQYSDKGSKAAQKDIVRLGKKIDAFGKKAFKSFGLATAAAGALAIKIGKDAVQGAMEDQKQQASLALALKNTTGATNSAIEANGRYLDSLELQVAIDNNQLIPALQKLALATGNLSKAQELLELSTDVAALAGVDLAAASTAIARAQSGQTTSLKRLNLGLDKALLASGDFVAIQKELAKLSKGQAAAAANTFAGRMETLRLKFAQITDKLGYALIPILEKLAIKIETVVIPAIERFIRLNQKEIMDAFEGTIAIIERAVKAFVKIAGVLDDFQPLLKILGSGILGVIGYVKLLAATTALKGFLGWMTQGFKILKTEMTLIGPVTQVLRTDIQVLGVSLGKFGREMQGFKDIAKLSGRFKMFGKALVAAFTPGLILFIKIAAVIALLTLAYVGLKKILEKFAKDDRKRAAEQKIALEKERLAAERLAATYDSAATRAQKAYEKQKTQQDIILNGFKPIEKAVKDANKQAAIDARYREMEQADLEKQRILQEQINKLKKFGVTATSEQNPIELAAAAKLLEKQGVVAKEEIKKLERLMEENLLLKAKETLQLRILDIQKALADQKLDTKEIEELSKKWGISKESVAAYIHIVKSVEDQNISPDEIQALADLWNTSTGNAEKFLQTYMRIQDGLLDSNEVFDLIGMGFFKTEEEARKYADYVAVVHDGLVDDTEFEKLRVKWNDTVEEVTDYFGSMGVKFDYDGTLISPVDRLATAWDKATKALQKFLDALNGAKTIDYNKFNPPGTPSTTTTTTTTPSTTAATTTIPPNIVIPNPFNPKSDDISAKALEAQKETLTALRESEEKGTAISFLLKEHIDTITDALSTNSFNALGDERARLNTMRSFEAPTASTFDPARFRAFESGDTIVNINVEGNLQTEQDLVNAIRNGLLSQQYNGDGITLQAV